MTKEGPRPIAHLDPFQQREAATICWETGVKTAPRAQKKPGVYVSVNTSGAFIKIASIDFGRKGATAFLATVADTASGNAIELHLDKLDGDPLATLTLRPTGALDRFESQSTAVTVPTGVHDLYLKFTGTGTPLLNFDNWKFE
jgi:arabinoxylan arabinofuranohydrolase